MENQKRTVTSKTTSVVESQSFKDYKISYGYSVYNDGYIGTVSIGVTKPSKDVGLAGMATGGSFSGTMSTPENFTYSASGMAYDSDLVNEIIKNVSEINAEDSKILEQRKSTGLLP